VADNQHNLDDCFRKLEKDVIAAQEDATERAIKEPGESDVWDLKTRHIKSSFPSTWKWQTMSEQWQGKYRNSTRPKKRSRRFSTMPWTSLSKVWT